MCIAQAGPRSNGRNRLATLRIRNAFSESEASAASWHDGARCYRGNPRQPRLPQGPATKPPLQEDTPAQAPGPPESAGRRAPHSAPPPGDGRDPPRILRLLIAPCWRPVCPAAKLRPARLAGRRSGIPKLGSTDPARTRSPIDALWLHLGAAGGLWLDSGASLRFRPNSGRPWPGAGWELLCLVALVSISGRAGEPGGLAPIWGPGRVPPVAPAPG